MVIYKDTMVLRKQCVDIVCNKCEKSLKGDDGGDYEGLHQGTARFGFDSKHFGDGMEIEFSLCEKCLWDLTKEFKISAVSEEWGG